jgi:hypothetical protein
MQLTILVPALVAISACSASPPLVPPPAQPCQFTVTGALHADFTPACELSASTMDGFTDPGLHSALFVDPIGDKNANTFFLAVSPNIVTDFHVGTYGAGHNLWLAALDHDTWIDGADAQTPAKGALTLELTVCDIVAQDEGERYYEVHGSIDADIVMPNVTGSDALVHITF